MPSTKVWDVDGWFVGTVEGHPVNCEYRFDRSSGRVEVQINAPGDDERQSAVSHSPLMRSMAEHVIQEFHCARQMAGPEPVASDPVPATSERCRLTFLHDYQQPGRSDPATGRSAPERDRARA